MSRNKPSKNQYSQGLTYVSATPSFLKHFGQPKPPSPRPNSHSTSQARDGREPLPERPRSGEWASGSDDEKAEREEEEEEEEGEDEWGEMYGGGEEGPQVVVLKEGRHLTGEEVKRERRRGESRESSFDCFARILREGLELNGVSCGKGITITTSLCFRETTSLRFRETTSVHNH
jgi:hypothetical protein